VGEVADVGQSGWVWGTIDEDRQEMCPVMMSWFDRVKMCIGWDSADRERIAKLRRCMDSDLAKVIEDLGEQLTKFKDTQSLMSNKRFARRLHDVLREWLSGLLDGAFDQEYVKGRSAFGRRLVEIDLTFEDIILLEELTRRRLFGFAEERLGEHSDVSTMHTLDKAFNLDLTIIYSAYLEVRDAEMERVLLDRFLTVTGFSRTLYENLAGARKWN
jgi:hypothetical protein